MIDKHKGHDFHRRVGYALKGLRSAWELEASLRTHAAATLALILVLVITQAPPMWWALMALTVAAVLASELFNTAIETLADHLHPAKHPAIELTKDVAAGAVLVSSLCSLVVGAAFLLGHVWPWWKAGDFWPL